MYLRLKFYLITFLFFSNQFFSFLWISGEKEFDIKKLEYFFTKNSLNFNSTSYPIPIKRLDNLSNLISESSDELVRYQILINDRLREDKNFLIKLSSFSDSSPIRNIDDNWTSKNSFSLETNFKVKNFSTNLNISKVEDDFNSKKYYFDGTNISYTKWNTIFGFGFINRWWGPNHNNNLILSNYARPSPGFYINSLNSIKFENIFSFLGPTDYSFFINRLEKDRHIKNPYLIGTRLSFNPINNLYLGFSRTLMIGGEGRSESLYTFTKAFFGALDHADNVGSSANKGYDYSNQLAGYDIKYDFMMKNLMASIYMQEIAEDGDTSPTSPLSGYMLTLGSELKFEVNGLLRSLVIEFTRTILDRHNSATGRNLAYEHGIYKSGYRYRGLPIGAFIDTDSKYFQISFSSEFSYGDYLEIDLFYGEPNTDAVGRNIWGDSGDYFYGLQTKYKYEITENLSAKLILTLTDKKLQYINEELDRNIIGWVAEYKF